MEQHNKGHGDGCICPSCEGNQTCMGGCCGMGCHRCHHHALRWVLGIVVILLVFWLGMLIGELKGIVGDEYGFGMHRGYDYYGAYQTGPNMMYGGTSSYGMMRVYAPSGTTVTVPQAGAGTVTR